MCFIEQKNQILKRILKCDAKSNLKAFDADNSGKISFSEFLLASSMPVTNDINNVTKDEIEEIFLLYDTNKDGVIDKQEMKHILEAVCYSEDVSPQRVNTAINNIFQDFDYNRDNVLSKKEFIDFVYSNPF